MKIVEINGGLGNQMCQYVFARFYEKHFNQEVWFDDIGFDIIKLHNGFELGTLFENANIKLVKNNFDADVWKFIRDTVATSKSKLKLPNVLYANEMEIAMVADEVWHNKSIGFGHGYDFDGTVYKVFSNQMLDLNFDVYSKLQQHEHIYFMGIWTGVDFSQSIKEDIVHEFQFPALEDEFNIAYKNDILSKPLSVGLHIRRGDFIPISKVISAGKYAKAIKDLKFSLVKSGGAKPSFYIFSDDLAWCKENIKSLGLSEQDEYVFIEGNGAVERSYIDMQLMTFCDYLIHNHFSTFCMGAAFASEKDIIRITC